MIDPEIHFLAWVHDARPNAHYVYHIGMLLHEREENPKLNALADTVRAAFDAGFVLLAQLHTRFVPDLVRGHTRDDDPQYVYIATRTRTRIDERGAARPKTQG